MNVLLDESIPKRLASSFPDSFQTRTVQQMGWAGRGNGELLRLAVENGFAALVTVDQGFAYQQNLRELPIPVIIMTAGRTRFQELQPLMTEVTAVLSGDLKRRIYGVRA